MKSRSHFRNDDLQRAGFIRTDMEASQAEQQRQALLKANRAFAAQAEAEEQAEHEAGARAAEQGEDLDIDDDEASEVDLQLRRLAELRQQLEALEQSFSEFGSHSPAPLRIAPGDAACRPVRRDPRRAPRSRYS